MDQALAPKSILVIEDRSEDYFALERFVRRNFGLVGFQWCNTASRALHHIAEVEQGKGLLPAAVVLDLNLPDRNGRDVLEELRAHKTWEKVPVIVFSSSDDAKDAYWCYAHGANAYQPKGVGWQGAEGLVQNLRAFWHAGPGARSQSLPAAGLN